MAWNLCPVVSPYMRVFSVHLTVSLHAASQGALGGLCSGTSPGTPALPTADGVWSRLCVTPRIPGSSAGTLGWGAWLLIGACRALESMKNDTSEECSYNPSVS